MTLRLKKSSSPSSRRVAIPFSCRVPVTGTCWEESPVGYLIWNRKFLFPLSTQGLPFWTWTCLFLAP